MNTIDNESLGERIGSMRFAVELLAEVMEMQGLATHSEIRDMLRTSARRSTPAATVVKALSAISQRVQELEERATSDGRPVLHLVRRDGSADH
jgi:hypothetical protein